MKKMFLVLIIAIAPFSSYPYSWKDGISDMKKSFVSAVINNPMTVGFGLVAGMGLYGCKHIDGQQLIIHSQADAIATEYNKQYKLLAEKKGPELIPLDRVFAALKAREITTLQESVDKLKAEHDSLMNTFNKQQNAFGLCQKITLVSGTVFASLVAYNVMKNK